MQRRSFVRNFFILAAGSLVGCSKRLATSKDGSRFIEGKVLSKGKGIAGVVVSDGFNVVQTTQKGAYRFPLHAEAEHVFVSIPSGYAFPHEKFIAGHYMDVQNTGELNFELEPLKVDDNRHQFIIWADPQVKNDKDVAKLMSESVPDVQEYVRSLPADTLIHGISVGDIVWDTPNLYPSYNAAVEQCGLPFFQVLGNHDMDYSKGGDETSDDTFKKNYGPAYYSFNRGQVHYIVLDDVWYLGREREYKGLISEQQLSWLQKDLAFVPKDKLIVLCLHIPVHNAVENNKALYQVLEPYKVHIMSGHTHYNNNIISRNIYEHVHGTLCGAWWTGPVCGDGTPPGYGVYEVDGTSLKWHYKSVGFKKEHQIRAMTETVGNEQELVANIWNWDPEWKVEWEVDGVSKGALPRVTDFDPLTVALYKGNQLPAGRAFVEPRKTEHIFKAVLPKNAKRVKVLAIDRFGARYEHQLQTGTTGV